MGEAKRRKLIDPNYGKPKPEEIIGGRTESEWQQKLGFTSKEWKSIKPNFRVVNTRDDVDDFADGVWIYKNDQGKETISFTGSFAEEAVNRLT